MNIGDGLTIQTNTINGKPSTGIFLASNNLEKNGKKKYSYKSKTMQYPLRNRADPSQKPLNENRQPKKIVPTTSTNNDKPSLSSKRASEKVDHLKQRNNEQNPAQTAKNLSGNKNEIDKVANAKPDRGLPSKENVKTSGKLKSKTEKEPGKSSEDQINTKFVTLTQDQLNTILSLVKTKRDIDVSEVLDGADKEDPAPSANDEKGEGKDNNNGKIVEPTSVPGLDVDEQKKSKSRPSSKHSAKSVSQKKKSEKQEAIGNLLDKTMKKDGKKNSKKVQRQMSASSNKDDKEKPNAEDSKKQETEEIKLSGYDLAGALGGFGSREQNRSKLENQRQQWIKELREQVERSEKMKAEKKQKRQMNSTSNQQDLKSSSEVIKRSSKSEHDNVEKFDDLQSTKETDDNSRSAPPSANISTRNPDKVMRNHEENLPAAMRSSFFLGEAAPREHAFSARKREQQKRWREELDLQRLEMQQRKEKEKRIWRESDQNGDESEWAKHFDTMQPVKKNLSSSLESENNAANIDQITAVPPQSQQPQNIAPIPSSGDPNLVQSISDSQMDKIFQKQSDLQTLGNTSGASMMPNIFHGEHTTAAPGGAAHHDQQRSSYLRTMTSLLDPAQIEAMEVKRRKQDEHRRAIAAQVEERRRKKEEEEHQRKLLEMEEDRRLAAERDHLAQKNEIERAKLQMQENLRERQTRELYHQMQEAQESALREKLTRREQKLRDRGHDTSRLEKTHQLTLETKRKVSEVTNHNNLAQASQSSITSNSTFPNVPSLSIPAPVMGHHVEAISPRQALAAPVDEGSPVSVMAHTDQGPIKLEISLSNRPNRSQVVETGVQTDHPNISEHVGNGTLYNSDAETEYIPLPQPRNKYGNRKGKVEKRQDQRKSQSTLKKYERGLDRQYDKFSRADRNIPEDVGASEQPAQRNKKREERKPKWGVGPKNKEFVPASKRYNNPKWQRKHEENIRRREEQLLEQQALNDPERLRVIMAQMKQADGDHGAHERASPPVPTVAHQLENANKNTRRTRSQSPVKTEHEQRSRSPPVPGAQRNWKNDLSPRRRKGGRREENRKERPESAISATTEQAKYRPNKHSRDSPVPETSDFVEYRRTSDVLDPNAVPSRPETGANERHQAPPKPNHQAAHKQDPLLNPDVFRQRDRQEQILREISILRQGLLLKQREVASYPTAMTHSMAIMPNTGVTPTNLVLVGGGNLPERTNDTPLM